MKPQLAVIKETKSNVDASWNQLGNKFCVGASSGNVFVGTFDDLQNFWVATPISGKKPLHSASVVSVRFDPLSGRAVASASVDGKCYVTSCYTENTDQSATQGPFGKVTTWGETLFSFSVIGWVNFVAWSPDASVLAYGTHDCELNFADVSSPSGGKADKQMLLYKGNPFLCGTLLNATTFIGCGYDKVPFLFKKSGSSWAFVKHLDEGINKEKQTQIGKGSFEQSNLMFKRMETQSSQQLQEDVIMKEMNTKHVNYINY
jgi:WD40 repeat protein